MSSDTYVLGVYFGHNASVALAHNGRVVSALSEERVRRIKNFTGFPNQAYQCLLDTCLDGDPSRIDLVVFPSDTNLEYHYFLHNTPFKSGKYVDYYHKSEANRVPQFFTNNDRAAIDKYIQDSLEYNENINNDESIREAALQLYSQELRIEPERFAFINHHMAHACSAGFNLSSGRDWLIFTLDASGDNICATVNRFRNGKIDTLSSQPRYASLGTFYREVTAFLGMKPCEHEFKVMGLAPYAKDHDVDRVYDKFEPLFTLNDDLEFESRFPAEFTKYFLLDQCVYDRFDSVAGAAQKLIEQRVMEWVAGWIRRTGIGCIAGAGGVFMNVKLNQRISELPEVDDIFVVPSAADESTAIGCCYYGAEKLSGFDAIEPVKDLYLGTACEDDEIERVFNEQSAFDAYEITRVEDIEWSIAELLAAGEVVGRVAGRPEWGARALGNRSLLADPRSQDTVRIINEMIKGRDFWMPFTPSVLAEDMDRYVVNPKNIFAPYMCITFDSTPLAREHLIAALHPYDFTVRPQCVVKDWNPRYHRMISAFKELTGVGGVLNTSLNLHGEPNVQSPADALRVLEHSGLRHMAIENWLVSKKVDISAVRWTPESNCELQPRPFPIEIAQSASLIP